MPAPSPAANRRRRLPPAIWLIVPGAFLLGLLLFAALWLSLRDQRAPVTPGAADASTSESAPSALPAPQSAASGTPADGAAAQQRGEDSARIVEPPPPVQRPEPQPPQPSATPLPDPARASTAVAIDAPPPRYPGSALRRGESGEVVLRVEVDADGRPRQVEVVDSSQSRALDRAAAAAVRRWRFRPALQDGQPVPSTVRVPINFDPAR